MNAFFSGLSCFFAGFDLIVKPGIKRYVAIPLIFNIIFFTAMFFVFHHYFLLLDSWINQYLPLWLRWLEGVLWILFLASFFLGLVYTFVSVSNILCAPFNSLLSAKIQLLLTGAEPDDKGFWASIKDAPRAVGRQVSIVIYYLPRAVFVLLLFIVPVVQLAAPVLWLLFNAWFITLTYTDYPAENNHYPFRAMKKRLSLDRQRAFGLGFGMLFFSMIPLINLIAMPVSVAAATAYWVKRKDG